MLTTTAATNPWVLVMLGALGMLLLVVIVAELRRMIANWRAMRFLDRCMRDAGLRRETPYRATRYATPARRIH